MEALSPMMQQYQQIKTECPGALLFFRLGDFYEMFGADALEASKILEITLTSRNKKDENPMPMCGVPYHSVENYLARLIKAGKKVAICEQISDPSLPGIVKRKIVRLITPGTATSEQVLKQKQSRYITALFIKKDYFGLAFADLSTGEFQTTEFQGEETLKTELLRLQPAEMVLLSKQYDDPAVRADLARLTDVPLSPFPFYEEAHSYLIRNLKVTTLDVFGIAHWPFAIQASGLLLHYLHETQKDSLPHIDRIIPRRLEETMPLDPATLRNLEIFSTIRDEETEGTLLSVLDETETSMGGRLLRKWIAQPLIKKEPIEARHEAVGNLVQNGDLRAALIQELKHLNDLERLLGRLSTASGNARDLVGLSQSLKKVPLIQALLQKAKAPLLQTLGKKLQNLEILTILIDSAIEDSPALRLAEGGLIKSGFHPGLDELHGLMKDAKSALRAIEQEEIKATGIHSLKVAYNRVYGYYIEVSKTHLSKIPQHYIRKQTMVNAERFVTPELKEYEDKVLTAEERAQALEYEIFQNVRSEALKSIKAIKENAHALAELDVLVSFAKVALRRNYCRPELSGKSALHIVESRHPVVESRSFEQSFVPNDLHFDADQTEIALITGPNMSGKSTYLRQVALIVLMAQIGSFVPAKAVEMRVFDRIFTRVGASDDLMRGHSTFMVEMQESATILMNATSKSLIILDEVGRGTSTYDGLSLAWAIFENLHDTVRGFTLFATHYHELIELAEKLPRAKNYSIDTEETPHGVLFLHQIKEGGINKSYGIEVAKLAGLPTALIERANLILQNLEANRALQTKKIPENQLNLFTRPHGSLRGSGAYALGTFTHPALEKLKALKVEEMTPLEALNTLSELKKIKDTE